MKERKRSFWDSVGGSLVLFLIIFTGWIILSPLEILLVDPFTDSNPDLYTVMTYAKAIYEVIPIVIFMLIYKPDHKLFSELLPGKGNTCKNALIGLGLGFGFNMLCAVVSIFNKDISLYYASPNWFYIALSVIAVIIQAGTEEFVCRFFLYQHLYRGYKDKPWIAIVIPSLIFSLLHFMNPGFDLIAVFHSVIIGIAWALMVYVFDSFWMAWAYHFAWNFTQSLILGLPNSGLVFPLSIFKLDAAVAAKTISYDPEYGVEASLLALICNIVLTLILLYFAIKKRKAEKASLIDEITE